MQKLGWGLALFLSFVSFVGFAQAATPQVGNLPLSEVAGEPSALIGGYVNAVTGTYSEQQTDVYLRGAEPLVFQRYYNSSDWSGGYLCDGWGHNFSCWAVVNCDDNHYCTILFPHLSGGGTLFQGNRRAREIREDGNWALPKLDCIATLNDAEQESGLTNCANGTISGRTNITNVSIRLTGSGHTYATASDGSQRTFVPPFKHHEKLLPLHLQPICDRKASGNIVQYAYDSQRQIKRLATTNAAGKPLNWIEFDYGNRRNVNVRTSEGKVVQYHTVHLMQKGENSKTQGRFRLSEVINPGQPTICYQYSSDKGRHEQMVRRAGPDGRYLEVNYFNSSAKPKHIIGRVSELRAPVGTDATPISTYRFNYANEDSTQVFDALNHKKSYQFTKKRLTQITHYTGATDATYIPYCSDRFYWGYQDGNHRSDLVCRALLDSTGAVRSCRVLDYDLRHNVTQETLWGNLSGTCGIQPVLNVAGRPVKNGCEHVTTRYTYSNDDFNLLLRECEENGRTTLYSYKAGTDLLTARVVTDSTQIASREIHTYNEDGIRIRSVTDDGCGKDAGDLTGVTARCIEIIQPRMEMPGIGLPLVIERRYLDLETGAERQLSRAVNYYNKDLFLVKQEHYDAEDQPRYTLTWDYDAMGNVTAETNALGQVTQRRFDANRNMIFEKKPENAFATHYQYDFVNRCICEQQVYPDGAKRAHTFKYDTVGHKVAEVDFMGHERRYTYDSLGRLIETWLPESEEASGTLRSIVIRQEYDIAGNVTARTDGNGHRTEMSYTMCGLVSEVRHPDGSTERSRYNLDGTLARSIASNGLETVYTYDALKHVICKDHLSPTGTVLSSTSAVYKADRLLSETDANGNTTSYTYDGAGRQTGIDRSDTHTEFVYDALGRRHIIRECSKDGMTRVTRRITDLLDHITEEITEDGTGCPLKIVRYAYDAFGNRTAMTELVGLEQTPATTGSEYDADRRPIRITNPLGQVTVVEYDDTLRNRHNQRVSSTHDRRLGEPELDHPQCPWASCGGVTQGSVRPDHRQTTSSARRQWQYRGNSGNRDGGQRGNAGHHRAVL